TCSTRRSRQRGRSSIKSATREWVSKAEDDYRGARSLARKKPPLHDLVCFHCQQCVEKYLKALLEKLLVALRPHHRTLAPLRRGLSCRTRCAVETRYPGEDATKRQAEAALRWAVRVRAEARSLLGLRPRRP